MSEVDSEIVEDAQKQEIASSLVTLWELQLKNDEYVHFFSGLEADLSTVQFRDREDSSIVNSYTALPVQAEGVEVQSDGPSQRPTISFANTAAQYPLLQELLKGYDEAVANDYKDGKYQYALNKYIERELNKQKVTGYPTGIPETAKKEEADTGTTGSKSIPGDGVKFDSETYGQRKEDAPKINLASQRQMLEPTAEQKVDNPANIINESRETIAEIMEYDDVKADIVLQKAGLNQYLTSSLDEKKQALIAFNRQMAKDEIKNLGLKPEDFEL